MICFNKSKNLKKINKKKLARILDISREIIKKSDAKNLKEHPIYGLIKALTNYQLYEIIRELCEGDDVTNATSLFNDIGEYLTGFNHSDNCEKLEETVIETNLAKDAVLACAWDTSRFIGALCNIGLNVGNAFKYQKTNHMATYIYPIGLTIIFNGNHSSVSGILKSEGTIFPNQIYDLTNVYEYAYFDGNSFRMIKDDALIQNVNRFELGAIFEIGRMLVENGIR